MSLAIHYWMGDAHHRSGPPVSEMTYTVSSGTLNPSIPYHTNQPYTCLESTVGVLTPGLGLFVGCKDLDNTTALV